MQKAYAAVFSHQSEWYLESLIFSKVAHGVKCLRKEDDIFTNCPDTILFRHTQTHTDTHRHPPICHYQVDLDMKNDGGCGGATDV